MSYFFPSPAPFSSFFPLDPFIFPVGHSLPPIIVFCKIYTPVYLLGCVHPIMPYLVYPSSWRNWVNWVVFPDPVSPNKQSGYIRAELAKTLKKPTGGVLEVSNLSSLFNQYKQEFSTRFMYLKYFLTVFLGLEFFLPNCAFRPPQTLPFEELIYPNIKTKMMYLH